MARRPCGKRLSLRNITTRRPRARFLREGLELTRSGRTEAYSRHENLRLDFDAGRKLRYKHAENPAGPQTPLTPCCSDALQPFSNLTSGCMGGKPYGRTGFQERIIFCAVL